MKNLITYCKENGEKFGDNLLDYATVDMDIVRYYLDMAMPSMSIRTYDHEKVFSPLSKTVTVAEEAFAMLQLENNFERWIWIAEKEISKKQTEESGNDNENTSVDDEMVPDLKYQVNVKTRKDNVYTAGKWTEDGLERYNELVTIVRQRREDSANFEEILKMEMVRVVSSKGMSKRAKKRQLEDKRNNENKKKRVVVMNILNLAEV